MAKDHKVKTMAVVKYYMIYKLPNNGYIIYVYRLKHITYVTKGMVLFFRLIKNVYHYFKPKDKAKDIYISTL